MAQDSPDGIGDSSTPESEDVITSSRDRLDGLLGWLLARLPQLSGRTTLVVLAVVAAVAGLVVGRMTAAPPAADPAGVASAPAANDPAAGAESADPGLNRGLLSVTELAVIGEPATGGTYTRGSASAIPDPCLRPDPGDDGVTYVPGPDGATAVSFRVAGGSVTERMSVLADDQDARNRLREIANSPSECQVDAGATVLLGEIVPGLGDEFIAGSVVRGYPSGGSSTVAILLIRVGAVLVEFSLTGPTTGASEFAARCLAIARAGLAS